MSLIEGHFSRVHFFVVGQCFQQRGTITRNLAVMKASSTAINRFGCQALDAGEEGSVQATRVPPELNQTVHTVAAVGIGVDVLGAGCQNGSGIVPPCR